MANKHLKLIETMTFTEYSGDWYITARTRAKCRNLNISMSLFMDYFRCYCPAAVCLAAQAFLCSRSYLKMSYDGFTYTWHIDKYGNIIYRIYLEKE